MDLESLVGTVSQWQKTNEDADRISQNAAEGISTAFLGRIASLILPSDHSWVELPTSKIFAADFRFAPVDKESINAAARLLRTSSKKALFLGGRSLLKEGLCAAARIASATGCDLLTDVFPARIERGTGYPIVHKLPYFPEQAAAFLSGYKSFVFSGSREPVAFFGYKDMPSFLLNYEQSRVHIGTDHQNETEALNCLADELDAPVYPTGKENIIASLRYPGFPEGTLTSDKVCQVLAALQPENAIVVDESLTSGFAYYSLAANVRPHTLLYLTGGAIGQGIPSATGAAIACPDRPVINFQADGSALYTLQALWTQARENLNVTTLICSNRSYNIIRVELKRAGFSTAGPAAARLTDLSNPDINWVQLSQGFGVPATAVFTVEELKAAFSRAIAEPGPHLIEIVLQT
jgi:acetolactate synthase-1/2/3 large subunit